MIHRISLIVALILAGFAAYAQDQQRTQQGSGAILRSLDRTTAVVQDHEVMIGETFTRARLDINLLDCRYPSDDLDADAFAQLEIIDNKRGRPLFLGWMVASSPALSALQHPRYDVWVLKCITS